MVFCNFEQIVLQIVLQIVFMSLVFFSYISVLCCLVIDDMLMMCQNICMYFGQLGVIKVDQVVMFDEVICFVQFGIYDLIICDYNFNKESNGQQLLEFFCIQNMFLLICMFIMVMVESGYNLVVSVVEFQFDVYMLKLLMVSCIVECVDCLLEKQYVMLLVIEKMKCKDIIGVIIECDNVFKLVFKWIVEIMKIKGMLLIEQCCIDEVCEVYKQVLVMCDDLVWVKIGLVCCNIVVGQMDDVCVIVQDVLVQNKQFIVVYDLMVQIDEVQGNQEGVLEVLIKFFEIIFLVCCSCLVGDVVYCSGYLDQVCEVYDKVLKYIKGLFIV